MGNLRAGSTPRPAEEWPDWVDDDRWVPTCPSAEDAEWWAAQGKDHHAEDGPDPDDPIWDQWAGESATQDMLERGLSPF